MLVTAVPGRSHVSSLAPIERFAWPAHRLVREHPPVFEHQNKRTVYDVACPTVCVHEGEIGYTRWRHAELPTRVDAHAAPERVEVRHDRYDYVPLAGPARVVEWHVDFADPMLFVGYGSGLFAQEEIMVAEHPALASVVEALHAGAHAALTVDAGGPTPVLVTGVERRCAIDTDPRPDRGRSQGLYGRRFASANARQVRDATRRIDPPTVTNIIAMAAPAGGSGIYTREEIEGILLTAYTAFAAAVAESATLAPGADVVVHTGYWGCGAFGGNRVLMSLLQMLAAEMAGVGRLVFHTVSAEGATPFDEARDTMRDLFPERVAIPVAEVVLRIISQRYEWGMSDGN